MEPQDITDSLRLKPSSRESLQSSRAHQFRLREMLDARLEKAERRILKSAAREVSEAEWQGIMLSKAVRRLRA